MCLILFAWQSHPRYELVIAANRDEFHDRPAAAAKFWKEDPNILAGRDLQAGGTWMGVTRQGRIAAITNYREHARPAPWGGLSRGFPVREYLGSVEPPQKAASHYAECGDRYSGFNLLVGAPGGLWHVSNRGGEPAAVTPGIHGLSNHLLDTDWPKVEHGRQRLQQVLDQEDLEPEALFSLINDRSRAGGDLPEGVEPRLAPEELMRHYFILSPVYGTRCSTVILAGYDGRIRFEERSYAPDGRVTGTVLEEIEIRL